jgi:hypothetical protein
MSTGSYLSAHALHRTSGGQPYSPLSWVLYPGATGLAELTHCNLSCSRRGQKEPTWALLSQVLFIQDVTSYSDP